MKRLIYFLFCFFALQQLSAQNCAYTVNQMPNGTYVFNAHQVWLNGPYNFVWNFGDGATGIGNTVTHQYVIPGAYTVCYDIYDTNNVPICNYCDSIYVAPPTNNCYFTATPDSSNSNTIHFSGVPSSIISSLSWDFGNGQFGIGNTITASYNAPGVYTVCMTEGAGGAVICQTCQAVQVGSSSAQCAYVARPDSMNPLQVDFIAMVNYTGFYTVNWTYGDGSAGTGYVGSHTYASGGSYTVCMEAIDSIGNVICTYCGVVSVSGGGSGSCAFTYAPSGPAGLDYTFHIPNSQWATYSWYSAALGVSGTGSVFNVTYPPGSGYDSVCVSVTDFLGNVCYYCDIVLINNNPAPCQAMFASAAIGLDAYFIDFSQTSTGMVSYQWSFGDGTSSTQRFPQHTYSVPGFYNVCLNIQDGSCNNSTCQQIYVDSVINVPTFCNAFYVVTQTGPFQLTVVNLSSGLNLSYLWDFGDGNTSTQTYPSHSYASTGVYNLCLTVSDSTGCTSTYCDTIGVDSLGRIIYRGSSSGFNLNVMAPNMITASIDDIARNISSAIYPNPASNSIRVRANELKGALNYRILNLQGGVVANGSAQSDEAIRVDELSPGMYMIEITDSNDSKAFGRFMKN